MTFQDALLLVATLSLLPAVLVVAALQEMDLLNLLILSITVLAVALAFQVALGATEDDDLH